jgi:hypothetical protein
MPQKPGFLRQPLRKTQIKIETRFLICRRVWEDGEAAIEDGEAAIEDGKLVGCVRRLTYLILKQ